MNDKPITGAAGLVADVARLRAGFRERIPSYWNVLGHVRTMLEEPGSVLLESLDRLWQDRPFHVLYDRPLLLLAALRADALTDGPSHPLYAAIAARAPSAETATYEAVRAAFAPERVRLFKTLAARRVQTNETLRS